MSKITVTMLVSIFMLLIGALMETYCADNIKRCERVMEHIPARRPAMTKYLHGYRTVRLACATLEKASFLAFCMAFSVRLFQ
jgi:hypothetical protein